MAGENDRIAERLKEVEDGGTADGGTNVDGDSAPDDSDISIDSAEIEDSVAANGDDTGANAASETEDEATMDESEPITEISTSEILQSEPDDETDMSVAEQLGTAADFEKRAAKLRRQALEETEGRLAACFDRTVEVDLDPQADGALVGTIRLPGLSDELDDALDEQTSVTVDHISVAVGDLKEEDDPT